jgi:hypothetical protein
MGHNEEQEKWGQWGRREIGAQWRRREIRAQCGEEEKWGTMGKKINLGLNVGKEDKFGVQCVEEEKCLLFSN